jgi:hypothetical protein
VDHEVVIASAECSRRGSTTSIRIGRLNNIDRSPDTGRCDSKKILQANHLQLFHRTFFVALLSPGVARRFPFFRPAADMPSGLIVPLGDWQNGEIAK